MIGNLTMPFGERLKQMRERAGLSQSELAVKAGLSLRSIQNWEQGHRLPRIDALLGLARALDASMESLAEEPAPKKTRGKKKK